MSDDNDELGDGETYEEWYARLSPMEKKRHDREGMEQRSESWQNLPDPAKRLFSALARQNRLDAINAPAIVLENNAQMIRKRIGPLREYLDLLHIQYGDPKPEPEDEA